MQCKFCGSSLPSDAHVCPTCGNMVNSNAQGYNEPTQYGNTTDNNPGQTLYSNPTEAHIVPPPPNYGASPYPQSSSSPYNQPYPAPGVPPYQQYQQQGVPPYQQQANSQPGIPYGNNAPYPGQITGYAPPTQKPRSRVGLIIGIIALVLVVLCVGGSVLAYLGSRNTDQTDTTNATATAAVATPTVSVNSPSGAAIDPQAAAIVVNPQTATQIDKETLEPVKGKTSSTFQTYQSIYVTFDLNAKNFDASKETDYINARFYIGTRSVLKDDPLKIGADNFNGYFSADYYQPTTDGSAELYWCHTSTCSDGKLAQVVHFTVTN